jgi:hypothetical protein
MPAVNFAVATLLPGVARRSGDAVPPVAGVLTLVGVGWLAELNATSSYLSGVALPMVLIGAGHGLVFATPTAFGNAEVRGKDAGAASGLVDTAYQLGIALGLAALAAAAANATQMVSQVCPVLTWGTGLLTLAVALIVVLAVVRMRPRNPWL